MAQPRDHRSYQRQILDLKATILNLEEQLKTTRELRDFDSNALKKEQEKVRAALAEAKTAREQFADLKERLLEAETTVARQEGYIMRVQEDDIVREPLVTTGNKEQKHLAPKRQFRNPMRTYHNSHIKVYSDADMLHQSWQRNGQQEEPPKHWTSYGDRP